MRHKQNGQLMAEGNPKKPKSPTKQLSDTDTSDEGQINPVLKTSLSTWPFQVSSKSYSGKRTQS